MKTAEQMDATDAIVRLLSGSLARRRDRYVEFASRPKARNKLLKDFYHQLAECFDERTLVSDLPAEAWSSAAYSYAPPKEFGVPWESLREAYKDMGEARLLVTQDGRFGIHTREDSFGGPVFIKV